MTALRESAGQGGDRRSHGAVVLVVDDSAAARAGLRNVLADLPGLSEVVEARSGEEALALLEVEHPAVVLMDIKMPGIDGIAATRAARDRDRDLPIIVYSGSLEPLDVQRSLEAGANGYTVKSSDPIELRQAVAAAIQGRGVLSSEIARPVIAHYVELLSNSREQLRRVIESLAAAVEAKDAVTSEHVRRVAGLAARLARTIDPTIADSEDFLHGCILHDVGKIGVPERILGKPAPLTADEWEEMRKHPLTGVSVIEPLGLGPVAHEVVRHHHERWDGSGYPDRLERDEIPLAARIFSVCDAIDAMTSDRPYRRALGADLAVERVRSERGRQFDPAVLSAFDSALRAGDLDGSLNPTR